MKKVKIIFTGGTIGSLIEGTNINTDVKSQHLLLNMYEGDKSRFTTETPLNILSENLNVSNWLVMIAEIKKAIDQGYEGIVITHGSDTLAYTAPFLSYVFHDIKIPVVLVASHKPLSEKDTNGLDNFKAAITLIDNLKQGGVFVAYRNPDEKLVKIHLGSRIQEPSPFSDSFESGNNKLIAKIYKDKISWLEKVKKSAKKWDFNFNFSSKQIIIRPHPGLDYSLYMNTENKPNFILHDLYHSGTANTINYPNNKFKTNLLEFSQYCKENNIDLYICNIKDRLVHYDSTNKLINEGVTALYDTVINSAFAKLMVAYNFLDKKYIKDFLFSNVCGEIVYCVDENAYEQE